MDDETVLNAISRWSGAWPTGHGITLDGSGAGDMAGLVISSAANCHRLSGEFSKNPMR